MKLQISYNKNYVDSVDKLTEELYGNFPKCKVITEEIDEDKREKIDALLKESEDDPEVLTEKISEIMGFKLYN